MGKQEFTSVENHDMSSKNKTTGKVDAYFLFVYKSKQIQFSKI